MTETEKAAIQHIAASSCTRNPRDLAVQAMLIRSARTRTERMYIQAAIMYHREGWLNWLTKTQRDWQTKVSRRPSRARHHDSIQIRERYVRVQ